MYGYVFQGSGHPFGIYIYLDVEPPYNVGEIELKKSLLKNPKIIFLDPDIDFIPPF